MSDQPRDEDPYANLPQNWTGGQAGPMVVVAPPSAPEPSATRGVTGLFVLMFLALAMVTAMYFVVGAWQADQRLRAQQLVSRDAQGLREYLKSVSIQNSELCQNALRADVNRLPPPPVVERPNLVAQIKEYRAAYESECNRAAASAGRDIPGLIPETTVPAQSAQCSKITPNPLSVRATPGQPANPEKARQLLATICARYQGVRR